MVETNPKIALQRRNWTATSAKVCEGGINNLVKKSSKLGALEDRTLIGSNQLLPNAISVCVCF
jgi:hypothetical protein